jgi:hypothetical protein
MISHNEALTLISARQDQMLDPIVEHELNAHLATCDSCRAFARSTDALTQGLRTLPYLPASPTVRRAVLDRVEQGRSPWARLSGLLPVAPGPALSTVALIALVMIVGFFTFNRFVLQDPGDNDSGSSLQLASQPTEQVRMTETAEATRTQEPTATDEVTAASTEPTATDEPTEKAATEEQTEAAPTETEAPSPTETTPPEPTNTAEPEPTATSEPTPDPTDEPEPTETPEQVAGFGSAGTEDAEATEDIADLTIASSESTEEITPEPTATVEPTATNEPTPEPTATIEPTPEPTATTEPTPEPTATIEPSPEPTATTEPTATAEPTESPTPEQPQIVPINNTTQVTVPEETDEPTAETATEIASGETDEAPTIGPVGGQEAGGGEGQIEPMDPEATSQAEVPDAQRAGGGEPESTRDLAEASQPYQSIAGDPGGRLVLTDGRMIFDDQAHAPALTTPAGRTLQTVSAEGGEAVALCDTAGTCTDISSGSRDGEAQDTPLGIIGAEAIYLRYENGAIEYRRSSVEGDTVLSDELLYSGDSSSEPQGAVYYENDRLWIPTVSGSWVILGSNEGSLLPGSYTNPQLVRFAETDQGLLVGYESGGELIIARGEDPGTPILILPFGGADFDISPRGDRIVVSTGSSIDIYDLSGALITTYGSDNVSPGTVLWLNSGIVYLDQASGALNQIPESAS